jgi:ketosteroid isomerase-like protein
MDSSGFCDGYQGGPMTRQLISIFLLLTACTTTSNKLQVESAKQEIVQTEKAFEALAKEKGLSEAFSFYADSAATINRGNNLVHGKDSIRLVYLSPKYNGVTLEWKPDFVDVSASADFGYTYGEYTFTAKDSTGKAVSSHGYFHTVWKKQAKGNWRYVWD